jgi:hypothetical protein
LSVRDMSSRLTQNWTFVAEMCDRRLGPCLKGGRGSSKHRSNGSKYQSGGLEESRSNHFDSIKLGRLRD